ncbi:hypothetical protein [Devosia rhizoryzae]|uniref:DUF3072 domain-containing protein n=1 Tax=Devosia rhizoryzae TaxID=2774137 RepID=A0ABX7C2V0_9HYPH|nr:hypothetical protein [Devosia rhizoryzae]QQR38553.1 hypothetical protein JI748_12325 [Devosia rhizoryzae]
MVQQRDNSDPLTPIDEPFDANEQPGLSIPYSQDEIEDLLYGSDRPVAERVERLKEMRAEMATRESGDFGDQDPKDMMAEIDRALDELQADNDYADENGDFDPALAIDPEDHLDALAPDDVDAREALTGEDEDDIEDGALIEDEEAVDADTLR